MTLQIESVILRCHAQVVLGKRLDCNQKNFEEAKHSVVEIANAAKPLKEKDRKGKPQLEDEIELVLMEAAKKSSSLLGFDPNSLHVLTPQEDVRGV